MKPDIYLMLSTRLRTSVKNEFRKDFKLMKNNVFGKMMEKIRNHKDMKLVTSKQKYQKYVMKPSSKDRYPFSKDLFAIGMGKTEIKINKPVHLGQAILDLSKMLMYEFHYDYMRSRHGSKVKLCDTDTDSFVYEIETEDFYRNIAKDAEKMFDTSMKTGHHPSKKKKVIGLMKDELGGKIMAEFVALRAKMHAYRKIDQKVKQKR